MDYHRALTAPGLKIAKNQGEVLAHTIGTVDLAIVSAAVRTSQTYDALRDGGLEVGEVQYERGLYEQNFADAVLDYIHEVEPQVQTLLLVFHQPAVAELALRLSVDPADSRQAMDARFSPATFAWGTVDGDWADLESWKLGGIVNPVC